MKINACIDFPAVAMGPTVSRKLLAYEQGENGYTINLMSAKAGAGAPPHAHPHLQAVYIISGEGTFRVGDETKVIKAGDMVQIDGNVPHTFDDFAQDTTWLEFFTPVREDYIPKA
ncbi:MAG: cupin domain-containing protein [Clostridia bacterium]|nr:cupin domain-containing protein [Clostridia bacterium]